MASQKQSVLPGSKTESGKLKTYVAGFASSILLTLAAYLLAINHAFSGYVLIVVLLELAIVQFTAQLFFFLHFGEGKSAYWRLITLILMIVFVLIVVLGSIWIMASLNYNMSPEHIQNYMKQQINEGF